MAASEFPPPSDDPRCVAMHRLRREELQRWLPKKERSVDQIPDKLRRLLAKLATGNAPWPLFLHGEAGAGKTCTALVVLDYCGGLYYTARQWCQRVWDADFGRLQTSVGYSLTVREVWREWERARFVVLDELGSREQLSPSSTEPEIVQQCLDLRYGAPAMFISNYTLNELAQTYGDPVASRLSDGVGYHVTGDRRLMRQKTTNTVG